MVKNSTVIFIYGKAKSSFSKNQMNIPSIEPKTGDVVVAMIDGEYTIKKLQTHPHPQLIPCNREYSPIEIGEYTEVTIIGPVISVIRKYR